MPPKAKFTKEEIISAAFDIVKRDGMDVLTARSLAEELGSSPRPIFTVFDTMEEVQTEVLAAARSLYSQYQERGLDEKNPFKGSGMGYLKFATEQPKLFQLMFMKETESVPTIDAVLSDIEGHYGEIVKAVIDTYGFTRGTAEAVYLHAWIYTHGIASLIATNFCKFTEEETSRMLDEVVGSVIKTFRTEGRI